MDAFYAFISGPGVYIACALFVAGLALQGVRFFRVTRSKDPRYLPPALPPPPKKKAKARSGEKQPLFDRLLAMVEAWGRPFDALFGRLCNTIAGTHPVMTIVTVVFHVLLFATPLLLTAHNVMITRAIGFSLPSLPQGVADTMTFLFLLCGLIFLFRRIAVRRVRAITAPYDYLVLLITVLPYLTGFLAAHQLGDYRAMMLLHVLAGEAMLILVPFTRLGHALFFFLYRFLLGSEYSFGQGKRAW